MKDELLKSLEEKETFLIKELFKEIDKGISKFNSSYSEIKGISEIIKALKLIKTSYLIYPRISLKQNSTSTLIFQDSHCGIIILNNLFYPLDTCSPEDLLLESNSMLVEKLKIAIAIGYLDYRSLLTMTYVPEYYADEDYNEDYINSLNSLMKDKVIPELIDSGLVENINFSVIKLGTSIKTKATSYQISFELFFNPKLLKIKKLFSNDTPSDYFNTILNILQKIYKLQETIRCLRIISVF